MINEKDIITEKFEFMHVSCMKRFSWSAVIVGALVGIGITFLLNLFSIAISLSAFNVNSATGAATIAVGGLVGIAIGIIASMFTAGWVAGYLGRPHCFKRNLGILYGFTAWCLAFLIGVFVASHVGHYVAAYTSFISHPAVIVATSGDMMKMDAMPAAASTEVVVTQKAVQDLAISAFVVFLLFFLSALAACFGGHCGMCYRCGNEKCDIEPKK